MIKLVATPSLRNVQRRLGRLARQGPKWYAQELNKQLRASKGGTGKSTILPVVGMTRRIRNRTGIAPQKRIARRIRFPRAGFANAKRLIAGGLTLFEAMPRRYFDIGGVPSGAKEITLEVDPSGRQLVGGVFEAALPAGKKVKRGKMRRAIPQRAPRTGDKKRKTHLPINWSTYVDLTPVAYQERRDVLKDLARYWPAQLTRRWQKEFKRLFGA